MIIVPFVIFYTFISRGVSIMRLNSTDNACYIEQENRYVTENDVSEHVFLKARSNQWERPVKNPSLPIEVSFGLAVRGIIDIDERSSLVQLGGYLHWHWYDEIHVWNQDKVLSCIDQLVMPHGPETGLWIPEFAFSNGDSHFSLTRSEQDLVRIQSNGWSTFSPGGLINFRCTFDVTLFPFDKQVCALVFESWRYQVKYQIISEASAWLEYAKEHEQWELLSITTTPQNVTYPNGAFSRVVFQLEMRRKATYYSLSFVLPSLLLATVEFATFFVPFHLEVRLEVSFTSMLAFSVFQSMIFDSMPHSADNPPLMLIFIALITMFIAMAIYAQATCLYLNSKANFCLKGIKDSEEVESGPAPEKLISISNKLAILVMVEPFQMSPCVQNLYIIKPAPVKKIAIYNSKSWLFVAKVIDRFSLCLYFSLVTCTSIFFLGIIPAVYRK